jgi:hypothetical protein
VTNKTMIIAIRTYQAATGKPWFEVSPRARNKYISLAQEILFELEQQDATLSKPVGEGMSAFEFARYIINLGTHGATTQRLIADIEARDAQLEKEIGKRAEAALKLAMDKYAQLAQPPEGYAVVPLEPTEVMLDEGFRTGTVKATWTAMVNAAPEVKNGETK